MVPDIPSQVLNDDEILQWLPGPYSATPARHLSVDQDDHRPPTVPADDRAITALRETSTSQQALRIRYNVLAVNLNDSKQPLPSLSSLL